MWLYLLIKSFFKVLWMSADVRKEEPETGKFMEVWDEKLLVRLTRRYSRGVVCGLEESDNNSAFHETPGLSGLNGKVSSILSKSL